MELICETNKETWDRIRNTPGFSDLRYSSPHLLREIDYKASKSNFISCGDVVRAIPVQ